MKRQRPLIMVAAALAAILLITACGTTGDDDADGGGAPLRGSTAGEDSFASAATPAVRYESDGDSAPGPAQAGSLFGRKLIVSATIDIEAEDVDSTYRSVAALAQELGGFVAQSDFSLRAMSDGERREFATVVIRVPSERYGSTLERIRRMDGVSVMGEEARTTEVTEEYVDLQSRLRNLEHTEARYLELLDEAKTVQDILAVSDRLDAVRLQIEQIEGRLQALDELVELASITVVIAPVPSAAAAGPDSGPSSFGEAFQEGWEWSLERIEYLIAGLGYATVAGMWAGGPVLLVLGVRRWRRPRAERPAS
ncbi:MAG: hypothetical protein Kow0010_14530 [Dehalococcoidia bacterium]